MSKKRFLIVLRSCLLVFLVGYFLLTSLVMVGESVHLIRSGQVEEVCYFGYQVQAHDQALGWVSGEHTDGGDATFGDVSFLAQIVWGLAWAFVFMVLFGWSSISSFARRSRITQHFPFIGKPLVLSSQHRNRGRAESGGTTPPNHFLF